MRVRAFFAPALAALALGCSSPRAPRKDDPSALTGTFERQHTDVLGDDEASRLFVTRDSITFVMPPFYERVSFEEVACSSPTECKVSGAMCSATLTKTTDGTLHVEAGRRCEHMQGDWTEATPEEPGASASARPPPEDPSADLPDPDEEEPDAPSSTSKPVGPCLLGCNDLAIRCTRACAAGDKDCGSQCNAKGFSCGVKCTSK